MFVRGSIIFHPVATMFPFLANRNLVHIFLSFVGMEWVNDNSTWVGFCHFKAVADLISTLLYSPIRWLTLANLMHFTGWKIQLDGKAKRVRTPFTLVGWRSARRESNQWVNHLGDTRLFTTWHQSPWLYEWLS